MSKHKKQHYIPAVYLKAWCDDRCPEGQTPYIWVFDRSGRVGARKAPKNTFHETDLYTILGSDGRRDLVLENGLAQMESEFSILRSARIDNSQQLNQEDRLLLCVFVAAMHARTLAFRDHQADQWGQPLKMMREMNEALRTATEAEKTAMGRMWMREPTKDSISYSQVEQMAAHPLQNTMLPTISALAPLLMGIDLGIMVAEDEIGFITSDAPCVWIDPDAPKRPPMYQSPALCYETVEITLPLSPTHCVFLNRRSLSGYLKTTPTVVDEMNRRTRWHARESFVVNCEMTKEIWFDLGVRPPDSWEDRESGEDG